MERRHKLIILIIIGLVLLALGIWYLLVPIIKQSTIVQPPDLPTQVTPSGSVPSRAKPSSNAKPVSPEVKALADLASIIVARVGSGSSDEGFRGYDDVELNVTATYRDELKQQQLSMRTQHPATGPIFGLVTRPVAVNDQEVNVGDPQVTLVVQAQQVEDQGNPAQPTKISYKEISVTFEKQADGRYLVSDMVWKDIQL